MEHTSKKQSRETTREVPRHRQNRNIASRGEGMISLRGKHVHSYKHRNEQNESAAKAEPDLTDAKLDPNIRGINNVMNDPAQVMFFHKNDKENNEDLKSGSHLGTLDSVYTDTVTCLDFDLSTKMLYTAGKYNTSIKVWDLETNDQVMDLDDHIASVTCMQLHPDSKTLITGSKDATLKLWDLGLAPQTSLDSTSNIDSCINTFEAHTAEITSVSYDNEYLLSASRDKSIRQWDLTTGNCVQTLEATLSHNSGTNIKDSTVEALQSVGAALATGSKDGIIRLWDLRSGKVVRTLLKHQGPITSLQFDSTKIITGSTDANISVSDLRTGNILETYHCDAPINTFDFENDKLVVAADTKDVRVINRNNGSHWNCDIKVPDESTTVSVKLKKKLMIEGRSNGVINLWHI